MWGGRYTRMSPEPLPPASNQRLQPRPTRHHLPPKSPPTACLTGGAGLLHHFHALFHFGRRRRVPGENAADAPEKTSHTSLTRPGNVHLSLPPQSFAVPAILDAKNRGGSKPRFSFSGWRALIHPLLLQELPAILDTPPLPRFLPARTFGASGCTLHSASSSAASCASEACT